MSFEINGNFYNQKDGLLKYIQRVEGRGIYKVL